MKNLEFLRYQNISIEDVQNQNKFLNELFDIDAKKPICIIVDGKKTRLCRSNFLHGFKNEIWTTLTLPQKLRLMRWQQQKLFAKSKMRLPNFIYLPDENSNINYFALATKDSILLNLENIYTSNGLYALTVIVHECVHHKDFANFQRLLKKISKYINKDLYKITQADIMCLPIKGKLYDYKNKRNKLIDERLQQDILLLKNMITSFENPKNTPIKKNNIYSQELFFNYLSSALYYISPSERHAFLLSILYTQKISKSLGDLSDVDKKVLSKNEKTRLKIAGKAKEMKKYYNMDINEIINMELIHKFNKDHFGNKRMLYIMPKLMEERRRIIIDLWEKNLGYYNSHCTLNELNL